MNKYLLCGLVFSFLFFTRCTKDEDNDVNVSNKDRNWYAVEDLPGEYNQLRYKLYKEYELTILNIDTLGTEERGWDAYGNPVIHTEVYDMGYSVYTKDGSYLSWNSRDTLALMKVMQVVEKWVCPYLPSNKEFHPKVLYLPDSLKFKYPVDLYNKLTEPVTVNAGSKCGVPVGRINEYRDLPLDAPEWRHMAGSILAARAMRWIVEYYDEELQTWYDLTPPLSNKLPGYTAIYKPENMTGLTPEKLSFFHWYMKGFIFNVGTLQMTFIHIAPSETEDLLEYIAHYYAYLGREDEFQKEHKDHDLILNKMKEVIPMIKKYEEIVGVGALNKN